jgi:hypothetical protein
MEARKFGFGRPFETFGVGPEFFSKRESVMPILGLRIPFLGRVVLRHPFLAWELVLRTLSFWDLGIRLLDCRYLF